MEILDLNNDEDTKTTDEMEPKKPEEKTSPVKEILSWVLTIAFAIVAAILIKNYVIINANIPSGSMEKPYRLEMTYLASGSHIHFLTQSEGI